MSTLKELARRRKDAPSHTREIFQHKSVSRLENGLLMWIGRYFEIVEGDIKSAEREVNQGC